jgi:hypothetical protein
MPAAVISANFTVKREKKELSSATDIPRKSDRRSPAPNGRYGAKLRSCG